MNIVNEDTNIVEMNNLQDKMDCQYYWAFDLDIFDFTLIPIDIRLKIQTPTLTLEVGGQMIECPSNWSIMIYSEDTQQLDVASMDEFTRMAYNPVVYNIETGKLRSLEYRIVNYSVSGEVIVPQLIKNRMLCHPVNNKKDVICLSSSDAYRKYLCDRVLSELVM